MENGQGQTIIYPWNDLCLLFGVEITLFESRTKVGQCICLTIFRPHDGLSLPRSFPTPIMDKRLWQHVMVFGSRVQVLFTRYSASSRTSPEHPAKQMKSGR